MRGWVVAAVAVGCSVGCEVAVELDSLENHHCQTGEKACPNDKRCARTDDPLSGCGDPDTCAPCVLAHANPRCQNEVCVVAGCVGDYRHCQGDVEGCETDLAHDPNNCGDCNNQCHTDNGYPGCSMKVCATGGCFEGFSDCDENPLNGCETAGECPFSLAP
jgi:hypothetical protein